jgi:formate/nitrite transporter FocA (FNT family)
VSDVRRGLVVAWRLILVVDGGVFDSGPYKTRAIEFVTSKQVKPEFHQIFLRGVGCNWLVCLAVYLGIQAKDVNSKIVAMWWPIFTFVSLGLDQG